MARLEDRPIGRHHVVVPAVVVDEVNVTKHSSAYSLHFLLIGSRLMLLIVQRVAGIILSFCLYIWVFMLIASPALLLIC